MKKNSLTYAFVAISAMLVSGCASSSKEPQHHFQLVEEVAATCTEDGVKEHYICTDASCDNKFFDADKNEVRASTLVIEALGHNYQEDEQLRYLLSDATCEQQAVYYEACSRCGKKGTQTFTYGDAKGHTYTGNPVITLVNAENHTYRSTLSCDDCDHVIYEEKEAIYQITKQATCTVDGSASITVNFSSEFGGVYNDTIVITAKGHVSDEVLHKDEKTHFNYCTVCGEKINEHSHDLVNVVVSSYPTDTENGYKTGVCKDCGYEASISFSQCSSGDHIGKHYSGVPATKLESGFQGYYYCDTCHKMILENAHVDGDGTWEEAGVAQDITPTHPAYLEATLTLQDVIDSIDKLESAISMNSIPSAIDKANYELASSYLAAYLAKDGTSENDITNIQTMHGAQNTFNLISIEKAAGASDILSGRRVLYAPDGKASITYDLHDEVNGVNYAKLEFTTEYNKWGSATFIYGAALGFATSGAQVLVRTNFDTSFHVYGGGVRSSSAFSVTANKWTVISITSEQLAAVAQQVASGTKYNTCYLSNNTDLTAGQTIEVSDIYSVSRTNLAEYTLLSNEGYSTLWTAGGLTGALSTNLYKNAWFADAGEPVFHPDYRNYFLETKISNASGADKSYSDLLVSNAYYGGLYFSVGASNIFSATPMELFFMVYSNEEVDIKYSNFGDIVRKGSEKQVLKETKIYKGWNLLHLDIDQSNLKKYDFSGHTLSIVPETWTTTLELTMSAMFYKE